MEKTMQRLTERRKGPASCSRIQAAARTAPPTYAAAGQFACPGVFRLANRNRPQTGTETHHISDSPVSLVRRYRQAARTSLTLVGSRRGRDRLYGLDKHSLDKLESRVSLGNPASRLGRGR